MAQSPKSHRYKGNYVSKNNALYKVSITKQGPMQIKLLLHPSRIYASVNGFDSNGLPGEAEQSGLIKIGDALVAINDIVLVHKRFEEVLEIIKSESLRNLVRHLYFCRKQYCQYIIEDRIDISAFLRTGVVSISTSSSIHNPHALSYAHQANIVAEDLLSNIELITYAQQADMVAEDLLSSTELVCKHEVNEEALRAMVSAGVPDDFINLRAVAWKVLLRLSTSMYLYIVLNISPSLSFPSSILLQLSSVGQDGMEVCLGQPEKAVRGATARTCGGTNTRLCKRRFRSQE